MAELTPQMVQTPRLAMNVWTSGPEDGRPLLLIHGNITTGGYWRYVADLLPDDVRVIAPDMRAFGRTEAKPVDATRGLGDMVDDVHGLLETLGLAGRGDLVAAGWSMGGRDPAAVRHRPPWGPRGCGARRPHQPLRVRRHHDP
jgi:pimeloyl-ACP methyl ester carboxylesterase